MSFDKDLALKPCPLAGKCGGCAYQGKSYSAQLAAKQKIVEGLLGGLCPVEPIVGMDFPLNYRNKIHAAFKNIKGKGIISGIYEEGSHWVLPSDGCMLEDERAGSIIADIRKLLTELHIRVFDESTCKGLVRRVLVRVGHASGQIMVVIVTASAAFPSRNTFLKRLLELHPEITTVVQNINSGRTSMILGKRSVRLYGPGYIEDELCGCSFRISPSSFYQVNSVQAEALYNRALELAGLDGTQTVLDAYCGTGTIGIIASFRAASVIGVELNGDAVFDARINAKNNGADNIRFYKDDAGKFMTAMKDSGERTDVVIMDPPRSGASREFIRSAAAMGPECIVYISCDPQTLARDLQYFKKLGYLPQVAVPYDMFPFTRHIEAVCLLVLRNPVTHVNIDVDVEELVQDKRGQATYEQIREYVLEQTGLKVSSLYISQIKRKCGLEVGDSYNKPKSEDAHVPQCPPEKEKAIMDALRHFGMYREDRRHET